MNLLVFWENMNKLVNERRNNVFVTVNDYEIVKKTDAFMLTRIQVSEEHQAILWNRLITSL